MRSQSVVAALLLACLGFVTAQDAKKQLFTTSIKVDGVDQPLVVYDGDSPYEAALAFGAKHGLAAEGVAAVTKHITAKAGKFLKRVFFYLPFYVDVAGKSVMQNLTVYEDSSPTELSKLVAQKFGLPQTSADRLRIEIEAQMVKRVQLRVNVDLQDGGAKQVLLVFREETASTAAQRFALQHGLTANGQKNLEAHIVRQLQAHPAKPFTK